MKEAMLGIAVCVALAAALSHMTSVRAEPQGGSASPAGNGTAKAVTTEAKPGRAIVFADGICHALAKAAADNKLPEEFFARLIWQESRFDPAAISPVGAQGIAQFMPETAATRGLANPFEPLQALRESASYLRELRTTFNGNLGLAAAAYNAGPGQVEAWLAGRLSLSAETLAYVRVVTGYTAEAWASQPLPQLASSNTPMGVRCAELAKVAIERARRPLALTPSAAREPWVVQLAGNSSEGGGFAAYDRLRRKYGAVLGNRSPRVLCAGSTFVVRASAKNRTDADAQCAKPRAAGGACIAFQQRAKAIEATFPRPLTNGVATLALSGRAPRPVTPITRGIVVHQSMHPVAVRLDLMQPAGAGRRLGGECRTPR